MNASPSATKKSPLGRRVKFWILRHLVLPVAVWPVRWYAATWRLDWCGPEELKRTLGDTLLFITTYHGMIVHLIAIAHMARRVGRPVAILISPSRDGNLGADFVERFGIKPVRGSSRSRGAAASVELLHSMREDRTLGMIIADGPRGPCAHAKPGTVRLAKIAGAKIAIIATGAAGGITLGSWDRMHIPWPFARVRIALEIFDPTPYTEDGNVRDGTDALQAAMAALAERVGSSLAPIAKAPAEEHRK